MVTVGSAAYVLGGFDGTEPLSAVLKTSDGRHFTVTGKLSVGVRYPAVAAVGTIDLPARGRARRWR